MTAITIDQAIRVAFQHHQAGRLAEAERIYRQILAQQPNYADALHALGVLAGHTGRPEAAVELIRRAIQIKPDWAEAHGNLGNVFKDLRQLDKAVASYRQAVRLKPELAGAHTNLGNALKELGQPEEAIASYRQAIRLKPNLAEAHNNLGGMLMDTGRLDEAIASYREAIRIESNYAGAHYNLGIALQAKGYLGESIASFRRAIGCKPDYVEAHNNLGVALTETGELDEAIAALGQAIGIKPDYAEAHSGLGNALRDKGRLDEAIASHRQAIRLKPDFAGAHNNLGNALSEARQLDEAIASYREAIRLKPDFAEAHNNLGNALKEKRQFDEALVSYRKAIALKADYAAAYTNIGNALASLGQIDGSIASYRHAVRLNPDDAKVHSNLVFTLLYHPGYDGSMIREELHAWNQRHAEPLKNLIQPHANDRDPDRRLRIGYVSPDLRDHVVGQNLLPLLREHDHLKFEIFCYADVIRPDSLTEQLRGNADTWRTIVGLSDPHAVELIREDEIDILVDLALHSANNRLAIFARKPAPVQVTYLGYCGSTGLDAMDYRLSDPYLDPPDSDLSLYSERTIRLPETYWCYGISRPTPEPSPAPAAEMGYITFGCLNNFAKVSTAAMDLWAEIMRAMPSSRLIIHSHPGTHLDAVRQRFANNGVSSDQLEFVGEQPWPQYVGTYGRIDIALDPFPWGGGITTCNALWMGVPVVTLMGQTAVGRGGASILANIGVPELIARTPEQYVQIATNLANDLPRLAGLRRTLRPRMQSSPLMDAARFARNVEAAYRQMWRSWCAGEEGM